MHSARRIKDIGFTSSRLMLAALAIFLGSVHGNIIDSRKIGNLQTVIDNANEVIDASTLAPTFLTPRTIVVDANGYGNFKSIQEAVDHVPDDNSKWIIIYIKHGFYSEQVRIPRSKPYIFMKGDGRGQTFIMWSKNSTKSHESAAFIVEAPNFVARAISFKNTAPMGLTNTQLGHSVAAMVGGDKAAFYDCGFFSNHNTLFDYKGRHYYDNCYIQGSMDIIFGNGQTLFHDCEVFVIPNWKAEIRGSIAAHHRQSSDENSGFVFVKGKVTGVGGDHIYLGRPTGPHSRVIFAKTYLSSAVQGEGWADWSYQGSRDNLYHAEFECQGPGAEWSNRAQWSKQLSKEEAAPLVSMDFVEAKEWLPLSTMAQWELTLGSKTNDNNNESSTIHP